MTKEESKLREVLSPCAPPFKIRWRAREQGWVKLGQVLGVCESGASLFRLTSAYSGRLVNRRFETNCMVEESDLMSEELNK